MGQILVTLNGRSYRLACGDGEEARLQSLAAIVKSKVDQLAIQFGQVGEERLFLMSALLIADEALETRERLAIAEAALAAVEPDKTAGEAAPSAPRRASR